MNETPPEPAADPPGAGAATGVVLIGYRGCGKSSVGARLAERLARNFWDTDDLVAARFGGRDAAVVFATPGLGEPAFREVEADVVAQILADAEAGAVIATGGGAVTESPAARAAVKSAAVLRVYLHAPAHVLAARIGGDGKGKRPGLTAAGADPADEVAEVLARRAPVYREVADEVVEVEERTVEEVVEAVASLMQRPK